MSLWSLLPAAISLGSQYLGKPKKEDYTPNLKYMEKYISNLRGKQSDREVYHMAMQPALRNIGAQGRKTQREIGYGAEKSGLAGSGIEAQQRLTAGRNVLSAVQEAGEKATAAQLTESRRLGEQVESATMQMEQSKEAGAEAYRQAKGQWQTGMLQSGLELAGKGIGQYIEGLKTTQTSYDKARNIGFEGTFDEYKQQLKDSGFASSEQFNVNLGKGITETEGYEKAYDAIQAQYGDQAISEEAAKLGFTIDDVKSGKADIDAIKFQIKGATTVASDYKALLKKYGKDVIEAEAKKLGKTIDEVKSGAVNLADLEFNLGEGKKEREDRKKRWATMVNQYGSKAVKDALKGKSRADITGNALDDFERKMEIAAAETPAGADLEKKINALEEEFGKDNVDAHLKTLNKTIDDVRAGTVDIDDIKYELSMTIEPSFPVSKAQAINRLEAWLSRSNRSGNITKKKNPTTGAWEITHISEKTINYMAGLIQEVGESGAQKILPTLYEAYKNQLNAQTKQQMQRMAPVNTKNKSSGGTGGFWNWIKSLFEKEQTKN